MADADTPRSTVDQRRYVGRRVSRIGSFTLTAISYDICLWLNVAKLNLGKVNLERVQVSGRHLKHGSGRFFQLSRGTLCVCLLAFPVIYDCLLIFTELFFSTPPSRG